MKLFPRRFDKFLRITIIIIVVLPVVLGLSNFFSRVYYEEIFSFFLVYSDNGYLGFQILYSFQYFVFVIMLIIYPLYPFTLNTERYFAKRDPESIVIEYGFLTKIVYILFPLFIFALAFIIAPRIIVENPFNGLINYLSGSVLESLFTTTVGVIFFVVGSALLKIILLIANKKFRYYFARVSFRIAAKKRDRVESTNYLIKALNSYNKYLRRNLGLQIGEPKKIYSKIISDPNLDTNLLTQELSVAFEDMDKLRVIKCLSETLGVKEPEQFLIKEPLAKRLEHWGAVVGTIVSTFAAIVGAASTLGIPGFS